MLLAALCVTVVSHAQVSGLLGTVTDESGEPIIGASVVEKGNPQNGTITNIDGQFSLKVEAGTALTVSSVGYITQDVAAANHMTVVLQEDNKALDEVVVIGYGVQKKSVVTAAMHRGRPEGKGERCADNTGFRTAGRCLEVHYPRFWLGEQFRPSLYRGRYGCGGWHKLSQPC